MPRTLNLPRPIHGLVARVRGRVTRSTFITRKFISSEDGNDFVARLESITRLFAQAFDSPSTQPEQVRSFLAIVRPSGETAVYVNELSLLTRAKIDPTRPDFLPGDDAFLDDIKDIVTADLQTLNHEPIDIPADCGLVLILPHRWRKALFYDFSVLVPSASRTDDLPQLFGRILAYLMFQELYSITEGQWERLIEWGWFPFIGLPHEDRKSLLDWARGDRKPAQVLEEISRRFVVNLDQRIEDWSRYDLLDDHRAFFAGEEEDIWRQAELFELHQRPLPAHRRSDADTVHTGSRCRQPFTGRHACDSDREQV